MLCKAKVTVCCEIVQNTQTQCEHHVEFLNVKRFNVMAHAQKSIWSFSETDESI